MLALNLTLILLTPPRAQALALAQAMVPRQLLQVPRQLLQVPRQLLQDFFLETLAETFAPRVH